MQGLSFLEMDELVAATPADVNECAARVGRYVAEHSADETMNAASNDFLLDVLTAPLSEGAIASWVGVYSPEVWDPVLVRCQLRVLDVSFTSRDEMFDTMLEAHADDQYVAELGKVDLPIGEAITIQQIVLEDEEQASDDEMALLEAFTIYVPAGDQTLVLLGNCSAVGWAGVWTTWVQRLALSLTSSSSIPAGTAVARRVSVSND